MLWSRIPEQDMEELRTYVEVLRRNAESSDYRLRAELEDVPDLEATEQAESVLNLVEELNQVMVEATSNEIKNILEQLDDLLGQIDAYEDYYLESIKEKTQEIVDHCRSSMSDDPEYISSARRDEVFAILKANNKLLGERVLERVLDEIDSRYSMSQTKSTQDKPNPSDFHALCNQFDDCVDWSYQRFMKLPTGEYVKKSLQYAEKFKKPNSSPESLKWEAELTQLRKKLSREDQHKLAIIDLYDKNRFEILATLLSEWDFEQFISQLKKVFKPKKKPIAS